MFTTKLYTGAAEMSIVTMEGSADCAAACLAMVLGFKRASQVYPLLGYDPNRCDPVGTTEAEVIAVLHMMRRRYHWCLPRGQVAEQHGLDAAAQRYRTALPTKVAVQSMLGSMLEGCAIVGVPALGGGGGSHFVYCRKGEVYDPVVGPNRYNCTANALPVLSAIFVED